LINLLLPVFSCILLYFD